MSKTENQRNNDKKVKKYLLDTGKLYFKNNRLRRKRLGMNIAQLRNTTKSLVKEGILVRQDNTSSTYTYAVNLDLLNR